MEAEVRPEGAPARTANDSSPASLDAERIYQGLSTYPFQSDLEFQQGLLSIIPDPAAEGSEDEKRKKQETVFQAQCFYFARKYNLPYIDPVAYSYWLQTHSSQRPAVPQATSPAPAQTVSSNVPATPPPTDEQPPYPSSFSHIVDLITRNQPIPGIEQIPDTVLEVGASPPNTKPSRRKPWETGTAEDDGSKVERGGVVSILQPSSHFSAGKSSQSNDTEATDGHGTTEITVGDEGSLPVSHKPNLEDSMGE